uniref:Uncharacterized protein n=1 Tax=Tanacetum cinerariifolium TaxID=118510 RepID=A0A699GHI6_TANCI|nr:hypothetical protein [Tanacetum cinerariifolium]
MENVPPPNKNLNVPEEEPILDQAPADLVVYAPQWIGGQIQYNNNGWLEEDLDEDEDEDLEEEPEKEEIEDENMVNDEDDEGNEEDDTEFGSNFHIGESLAMRDLLAGNSKVYAPGPMCYDLKSVHRVVMKLTLDSAVRENRPKNSKMMKMITGLSKEFTELKIQNCRAKELSRWEAWVRGRIPNNLQFQEEPSIYTALVPRADDPYVMVRDVATDTQGDEDDNIDAPWDTQPFKPRGSPRDSQ